MNKSLQKNLSILESLIATQKDCVRAGYPETNYMHGMLNGLICAHSIFANISPEYYSRPRHRKSGKIRHKMKRHRK
jgi:hypothetical protein